MNAETGENSQHTVFWAVFFIDLVICNGHLYLVRKQTRKKTDFAGTQHICS